MIMIREFLILAACLLSMCFASPDDGLCSQVYQMHQYCTSQIHDISSTPEQPHDHVHSSRVGKAGPRGPSGIVNYTAIEENIQHKFYEMESRFNIHMENMQEKMMNETSNKEVKFAELLRVAQELRPLTLSHCGKVTKDDAKIQNETGGVFDIYPDFSKLEVYCDLTTDSGGWMVFQRRMNGKTDFYRTWNEYVAGFGSKSGEFWLGLENLHRVTNIENYELRVDLEDWDGNKRYASYSNFKIGGVETKYELQVGGYTGDAGDSMSAQNGQSFTTKDQDNDTYSGNCAVSFKGAWWYAACHSSNLNGFYYDGGVHESYADGVEWSSWKGQKYSMKFVEMKIRPKP